MWVGLPEVGSWQRFAQLKEGLFAHDNLVGSLVYRESGTAGCTRSAAIVHQADPARKVTGRSSGCVRIEAHEDTAERKNW